MHKLPMRATICSLWLSIAGLSFSSEGANAATTEVMGGPGGGRFSMTCGAGQFIVGFYAYAGSWVDGIGLVCASHDANTGKVGTSTEKRGWTGGRGGGPQEAYCAANEAVTGITLAHTRGGGLPRQYVNTVGLLCQHRQKVERCLSSGEGCGPIADAVRDLIPKPPTVPNTGAPTTAAAAPAIGVATAPAVVAGFFLKTTHKYQYDGLSCPANEYATGIQGRSGLYVDAIGLICGPRPTVAPPPSPKPGGRVIGKTGRAPTESQAGTQSRTFADTWITKTSSGGRFEIVLTQTPVTADGQIFNVSGTFRNLDGAPQYDGTLSGKGMGKVFEYKYEQPKMGWKGKGSFSLTDNGELRGSGQAHDESTFTWTGARKQEPSFVAPR